MKPISVLYVDLAPHPGGSVISLAQLLQGLDRSQWRPMVALSRQNVFTDIEAMGIPVVRVHTPQWERRQSDMTEALRQSKAGESARSTPVFSQIWHFGGELRYWQRDVFPVARALKSIIQDLDPALVHLNDSLALMRHGVLAAWLAHTPIILHSRSFVATSAYDRRLLAPRLSGMIAISQAVAQNQLQGIASPPPVRVIPNAVSVQRFGQLVDREAVRQSMGIPPQAPLVGMIGRIVPWKGQHIFVEAFARLRQQHPQARAVIVGDADAAQGERYREEVMARAQALGIDERLIWLGRRRDMPQIMASLDILAHCSVAPEPFGRVIIEGMAAGTPVIASQAGGAVEIIEDGVTGLLTPPGDSVALAAAMTRLLTDASLRTRLRENARKLAIERYDIPAHVAAVTAFYETALRNGRARRS